jgi:hypothetical protein
MAFELNHCLMPKFRSHHEKQIILTYLKVFFFTKFKNTPATKSFEKKAKVTKSYK